MMIEITNDPAHLLLNEMGIDCRIKRVDGRVYLVVKYEINPRTNTDNR